eukprot:1157935-Pelagomonas_calceolata.AAC.28
MDSNTTCGCGTSSLPDSTAECRGSGCIKECHSHQLFGEAINSWLDRKSSLTTAVGIGIAVQEDKLQRVCSENNGKNRLWFRPKYS